MPDTPATFPQPGDRPAVLVTRPQPGADRLAAVLRGHGLTVLVAPLMRVVAVAHDEAALAAARGLVFTSAHAIAAAAPGLGRPAICVGPATAEAARRAGFDVTSGPGDAAGLMPLLLGLGEGWLHPRGVHVAAELPVPGIVVYDQRAQPLGDAARALLDLAGPVIVPVMSPRSARIAADATRSARAPLMIAAISRAAADAWTTTAAARAIAATPDEPGVTAAILSLAG